MLEKFSGIYHKLPYPIRFAVYDSARGMISLLNKHNVIRFLKEQTADEYKTIEGFLKNHELQMIPYPFSENYKERDLPVSEDEEGFLYIDFQGHRLYGKDNWGKKEMRRYFSGLLMERSGISSLLFSKH